ncbi:hypothetical protein UVI_02042930 [Ustilaginoidea virens]|uniref:molybdopterin molybdotransferase n=1 Tax=Ustilaginoidea virens TaxID=1159556 RepID=A0A1B5L3L7_USTVR|nr:hypothetical protein UVI_02042930 [Ustilaginoidea virens]
MDDSPLTAAILIVSTTAATDPSTDASASVLRRVLGDQGGKWTVSAEAIVSDHSPAIQRQILHWADRPDAPNLIITTGGTGFAVADGTPEVNETIEPCRVTCDAGVGVQKPQKMPY